MLLPIAFAEAAEKALGKLAVESLPVVLELLETLGEPPLPHEVVVLLNNIAQEIAKSPEPKSQADRIALALTASAAADRAAEELVR